MVTAVLPAHRNCLCGKASSADGLEIFHGQGVVGLSQERAEPGFSLQHCLPGGGVGEPSVHFQPDSPVNIRPQQCLRCGPQGVCVPALTAEIEGFHSTLGQKGYAAVCEFLRRGHGPGSGQLYHQIGPAAHGHLRPGKFLHTGCAAPLGEVAAHGAHQHPARFPGPAQQPLMSPVQGVKFTYNAHCVHGRPSLPFKI